MSSDIILDEDKIHIKGINQLKIESQDLILDRLDRRPGTDPNTDRRALVHDDGDVLSVNYNGDYMGGVRIDGGESGEVPLTIQHSRPETALKLKNLEDFALISFGEIRDWGPKSLVINCGGDDNYVGIEGKWVTIDSLRTVIGSPILGAYEEQWGGLTVTPRGMGCTVKSISLVDPNVMGTNLIPIGSEDFSRSALWHSDKDELIINSGANYKGGVKIEGKVELETDVKVNGVLEMGSRFPDYYPPVGQKKIISTLKIKRDTIQVDTKTLETYGVRKGFRFVLEHRETEGTPLDLVEEIRKLRTEVNALKTEVDALKTNNPI